MTDPEYTPPAVWTWNKENGGRFAAINRPTSGAQSERKLPRGKHPFQLYSLGTPNGMKVTIMFEELLAAGHGGAEYDAWLINIGEGDQFGSDFVAINPNSKIPALLDLSGPEPIRLFESGAMLLHLAEKFGAFIPTDAKGRAECLSWLMWQMGSAPFIGGGFGHFYAYAPVKIEYAIDRYSMETKRLFDVADKRLAESQYLAGDTLSIADFATFPWLGALYRGLAYNDAKTFLALDEYTNVGRWVMELNSRPATRRGLVVNRGQGEEGTFLSERHDASDFDKLNPGTI
ncbi:MAG: glutathione-dependent disulfide-bond oxidoreductase [Pseudomonadota bacterium]|nr:glutathione-dependent disulfide-bond oxidoreductase [Pseudomonadota bacterium]